MQWSVWSRAITVCAAALALAGCTADVSTASSSGAGSSGSGASSGRASTGSSSGATSSSSGSGTTSGASASGGASGSSPSGTVSGSGGGTSSSTGSCGSAPANTTRPAISGSATVGATLTGDPGRWSGTAPIDYTYDWERCDSTGSNCTIISSGTATSYVVQSVDVGYTIIFNVKAMNACGTSWLRSLPTAVVTSTAGGDAGSSSSDGGSELFAALGISTVRWGNNYPYLTHGSAYSFIGAGIADADTCESEHPGQCIVYTDMNVVNPNWWDGTSYSEDLANGWLLHDLAGNAIQCSTGVYDTNIGLPAYQQAFLSEVESYLAAHHLQGVFIDNFGVEPVCNGDPNWNVKEYGGQAWYQQAQLSFIKAVGPALMAQGYFVLVNGAAYIPGNAASNDGSLAIAWQDTYAPYVTAMMTEYWEQQANDISSVYNDCSTCGWTGHWSGWLAQGEDAMAHGIGFVPGFYGSATSLQQARYGRGSFLLIWDGGWMSSFSWLVGTANQDNWNSALAIAIGTPTAARSQVATGVWKRTYTLGEVIVNASTAAVTVDGHTIAASDAYIGP